MKRILQTVAFCAAFGLLSTGLASSVAAQSASATPCAASFQVNGTAVVVGDKGTAADVHVGDVIRFQGSGFALNVALRYTDAKGDVGIEKTRLTPDTQGVVTYTVPANALRVTLQAIPGDADQRAACSYGQLSLTATVR